jgi:hypothetical protein
VACVLTLLSGFEKTFKHHLPTQGVFLNYSSCNHHWANPAYNTSFSFRRMASLLNGNGQSREPYELQGRGETYSFERSPFSPDGFYHKLDSLSEIFTMNYLPLFNGEYPNADIFELSNEIRQLLVPDLITRDSA